MVKSTGIKEANKRFTELTAKFSEYAPEAVSFVTILEEIESIFSAVTWNDLPMKVSSAEKDALTDLVTESVVVIADHVGQIAKTIHVMCSWIDKKHFAQGQYQALKAMDQRIEKIWGLITLDMDKDDPSKSAEYYCPDCQAGYHLKWDMEHCTCIYQEAIDRRDHVIKKFNNGQYKKFQGYQTYPKSTKTPAEFRKDYTTKAKRLMHDLRAIEGSVDDE